MQQISLGGFFEWETAVYFCPLFVHFKSLLTTLTNSAMLHVWAYNLLYVTCLGMDGGEIWVVLCWNSKCQHTNTGQLNLLPLKVCKTGRFSCKKSIQASFDRGIIFMYTVEYCVDVNVKVKRTHKLICLDFPSFFSRFTAWGQCRKESFQKVKKVNSMQGFHLGISFLLYPHCYSFHHTVLQIVQTAPLTFHP